MADSFCLIPSKADPSVASLKEENASLKAELEKQKQQLANMELALKARQEQDQQLRDSIMIARKEVRNFLVLAVVRNYSWQCMTNRHIEPCFLRMCYRDHHSRRTRSI